ncbi:restriction endonuclease [uncultured Lutibacter sp.]|uniref:restriction endonuclease n=1 Tax=uncultured Lutibacter sp. TaxID=437739 RepID=UPI00262ED06E|nr:restriction endonuclease [uncultured Lutibacter sp.]
MQKNLISVKKSSGEIEPFEIQKLEESLKNCGASNQEVSTIIKSVHPMIYNNISSDVIYEKAFFILKKINNVSASKYSLKKALFDLGPTGYPFEKLVGALLKEKGFKTKVGVTLNGECVTHEIDILAQKNGNSYAIECKFHSNSKAVSNIKVPLYINSRFWDIQKQWNSNVKNKTHLKQGWLVTNTRFTQDAINYGNCIGLKMLSWDYPKNNGIRKNIDEFGLYPITVLTSLKKNEKIQLIKNNVILVKEIITKPTVLDDLKISYHNKLKIIEEAEKLCDMKITKYEKRRK